MAISFAGQSLIIILVGAMADRWGLRATYQWCALLGFAGVAFVLMLPRRRSTSRKYTCAEDKDNTWQMLRPQGQPPHPLLKALERGRF